MKTVTEMAREVYGEHTFWTGPQLERLERFAELVASQARADAIADEREACAKVCDTEWNGDSDTHEYTSACNECAAAIRSRSSEH